MKKILILLVAGLTAGCGASDEPPPACDSEPNVMTTADGVEFVRTPDSCFEGITGFPCQARYLEIDGLRVSYVDEGPADADPVLLLHGEPSWAFLYRKVIPGLVAGGNRVIAMDFIGMGRSDKPVDIDFYTYLGHIDRLERFITTLNLEHITLFCQDWGSLIGLHVAGEHPDWFARIVVGDGTLPVFPAGIKPFPEVENPDEIDHDLVPPFAALTDQQIPVRDENGDLLFPVDPSYFAVWMRYSMKAASDNWAARRSRTTSSTTFPAPPASRIPDCRRPAIFSRTTRAKRSPDAWLNS